VFAVSYKENSAAGEIKRIAAAWQLSRCEAAGPIGERS
jgi:hypothetical protein